MSPNNLIFDVYLSHAQADTAWAADVHRKFADAGLRVFDLAATPRAGQNVSDTLWEALAESAALVILLNEATTQPSWLLFELGAAMAWHKPVYALFRGQRPSPLPSYLHDHGVFPDKDVERVVKQVAAASHPLSTEEQRVLAATYVAFGTPTDQLLSDTDTLGKLTREFNRASKLKLSEEQVLRYLLRMRKSGRGPRLQRHRTSPRKTPPTLKV